MRRWQEQHRIAEYPAGTWDVHVQVGSDEAVQHGVAYSACVCDGLEQEGQDKCAFHPQDAGSATITCNTGYTLQAHPSILSLTPTDVEL